MSFVLKRILDTKDLDAWAKLKKHHFTSPWSDVYSAIHKYYDKYGVLPSSIELELATRDKYQKSLVNAIASIEVPEVETELLVDNTINEYAQNEALTKLDSLLDKVSMMEVEELVEEISSIALHIEDKTLSPESETKINQISTIEDESTTSTTLGICNDFDDHFDGLKGGTLLLYGGHRGSGKSVIATNMVNHQLDVGNSAMFFSVEMSPKENYDKLLAMRSGIAHSKIKKSNLNDEEWDKLIKCKAEMAQNTEELMEHWHRTRDVKKWEQEFEAAQLKRSQLVVVSDPNLTTTAIDAQIAKYKSKLGNTLKLVVVDYLNELNDFTDTYDWKAQIQVSKNLKKIARKHDIIVVSPYQTDEKGNVRFSKGIEIPADYSYTVINQDGMLQFKNGKVRGGEVFHFTVGINWPILKIDPSINLYSPDDELGKEDKEEKPKKAPSKTYKPSGDDLI